MKTQPQHIPVLLSEVLLQLSPTAHTVLIDATLGHGGHSRAYLEADSATSVIGLDADQEALDTAGEILKEFKERVTLVHSNFAQLKTAVPENTQADHILFDLGIGSHQLADSKRGFTFEGAGALTMRYGDQTGLPPADFEPLNTLERRIGYLPDVEDIVTGLSERDLAQLIRIYGEERMAGRVATAIQADPLPQSNAELTDRIARALPARYERGRIHPATRTYQALRLAVNRELESLKVALPQAVDLLKPGGRLAVISFHSLEDRIVKQFFRAQAKTCICPPEQPVCTCNTEPRLEIITKKPIVATEGEVGTNPRSRSAKLRVAQRR